MRKLHSFTFAGKSVNKQNEQRKRKKTQRVGKNVENTEIVAIVYAIILYLQIGRMEYNNTNK